MVTYLSFGLMLPENTFIYSPPIWFVLGGFTVVSSMLLTSGIIGYKNSVEFGRVKVMDKYVMALGIVQFGVVTSAIALLLGMTNASQVLFVVVCAYCILNTGYFAVNYKHV